MKINPNKELLQARINDTGRSGETAQGKSVAPASARTAPAAENSAQPAQGDRVTLSETALRLSRMEQSEGRNAERIEALRAAISDGSYQPDYRRIADKMLDFEG
ncbi:MAG: flagellar biosynthesis anti-sigma factor FlgM [Gammaproteobacteria bacterium]|nr:MAG: flagellar biosynthesis anti-sigma factor FlgM [Gammaproteobacteria bacterium]